MLNHGLPPIVVSRILAHSKPSITMDIYGHLYLEMQGETAKIMDDLVTPIQVDLEDTANSPLEQETSHHNRKVIKSLEWVHVCTLSEPPVQTCTNLHQKKTSLPLWQARNPQGWRRLS